MNKTVSIDVLTTPPGNIDLANEMIGQVIEPQARWTPGALTNSIMDVSSVPLAIVIGALSLSVFDVSGGSGFSVRNAFEGVVGSAPGFISSDLFTTAVSTTKSKIIECQGMAYPSLEMTLDALLATLGTGHPVYQVFRPKVPTFTISSLVNAIETALIANGDNYLILVDQVSESVTVVLFSSFANAAAALASFVTTPSTINSSVPVLASFATTFEAPTAGTPGYGWE